jgi:hypothetical protein
VICAAALADDIKPPGLSWIEYAAAVAGLLISLGIIVGGLMKLYNKGLEKKISDGVKASLKEQTTIITKAVIDATASIHPDANGGFSLPDVAKTVKKLDSKMDDVLSDVGEIRAQTVQNTAGLSEVRRMQRENTTALNKRLDDAQEERAALSASDSDQAIDIGDTAAAQETIDHPERP